MNIGGDGMAKETIQAVKQAEMDAAEMEKDAHIKSEELISKALSDAKTLVSTMTKEAKASADKKLEQTKIQGASLMQEVVERTQNEITLMKELAVGKEKEAIKLVISEIM